MEQRRLRLGDILDDYCPRERRVTNHAIVAMIEEDVKQTRCTTCDAEHVYKGGKAPRRKKKDATGTLYKEVLAGITDNSDPAPILAVPAPPSEQDEPSTAPADESVSIQEDEVVPAAVAAEPASEPAPPAERPDEDARLDEGPVHRQLIRATLPRPEGQKDTRPLPEFTVRSRNNGNFRDARARQRGGGPGGNGLRGQGGQRFAGSRGNRGPAGRGSGGRGQGPGFRGGQPRHGGKKRSR